MMPQSVREKPILISDSFQDQKWLAIEEQTSLFLAIAS
jgi:hypothetical protein